MSAPAAVGPGPLDPRADPHLVRMRDGVRLATDVYLPDDAVAPIETVLVRLPYDKSGELAFLPRVAAYLNARGYAVVAQDIRGKFRSEGVPVAMVHDVHDGYDTLEWIANQTWSNGIVGMWGDSYYGWTQWAAASAQHPALRAISPRVSSLIPPVVRTDVSRSPARPGTRAVASAYGLMSALTWYLDADFHPWQPDWSVRPVAKIFEDRIAELGRRSLDFDLEYPHPFPRRIFPEGWPLDKRAVPALITTGWWDNAAVETWMDLKLIAASPAWAHNVHVLIDSIDHESEHVADPPLGEAALRGDAHVQRVLARVLEPTVEFFDVFLKGHGDPRSIPRVRWNLAHTEGLRVEESWPPPGLTPVELHARLDRSLAFEPGEDAGTVEWTHDPLDPVPTLAAATQYLTVRPDEAPLLERADVAAFRAAPAVEPTDLVGPVDAVLTVSSTGPGMDVFVRLIDVAPDGTGLLIARGQAHVPGAEALRRVEIDMGQIGYRLLPGHRLALRVCSSDFPAFLPQPGTGEDPLHAVDAVPTTQRIHIAADAPLIVRTWRLPA